LIFCTVSVQGQVTKLTGENVFSDNSVALHVGGLIEGAEAGNVWSEWGVTFKGSLPETVPRMVLVDITGQRPGPPAQIGILLNGSRQESSANQALVADFIFPLRRVAFELWNDASVTATVTLAAFNLKGKMGLGPISQDLDLIYPTFVGLETSAGEGISKVVIDYGTLEEPEGIRSILLDYISRPEFIIYLPQIGDGIGSGVSLRTTITFLGQVERLHRWRPAMPEFSRALRSRPTPFFRF
ncbi:MAG: hypothetical protein ACRD1R_21345, partial [Acidobacteriota bacterium]